MQNIYDNESFYKNYINLRKNGGGLNEVLELPAFKSLLPEHGEKLHWIMDDYDFEGERKQFWFVNGVIKYHRKLSSIINTLIDNGFRIDRVIEPIAIEEAEKLNERLKEERRRPPFLLIKATKCK